MTNSKQYRQITVKTPARVCLFGDHQDYLGLPVIACAIDRFITLKAQPHPSNTFLISLPDIHTERSLSIFETEANYKAGDFFYSSLVVVKRYGCIPTEGYTVTIQGNIPINAGVSSSSAIVVTWIQFLLTTFGCDYPVTAPLVAELAYEAEVIEHNSPGGRMDQYTISIGNIIYIDTAKDAEYKVLGTELPGLILAESGIAKDTLGLLSEVRTKTTQAIALVKTANPGMELKKIRIDQYEGLSAHLPSNLNPYFYAAIANHSITQKALAQFQRNQPDLNTIGDLMNQHHRILKDKLKVTTPEIDAMIDAAHIAGACGAKIVGSGGGGCIVVMASKDKTNKVIDALLKSGVKSAYAIAVTKGSMVEND